MEPVLKHNGKFVLCRSILRENKCFFHIPQDKWQLVSERNKQRYLKEAWAHVRGEMCRAHRQVNESANRRNVQQLSSSIPTDEAGMDDGNMADVENSDDDTMFNQESHPPIEEIDSPTNDDVEAIHDLGHPNEESTTATSPQNVVWNEVSENELNELRVDPEVANVSTSANTFTDSTDVGARPFVDVPFDVILRNIAIERNFSGATIDYIMNTLRKNNSHPMFQSLPKSHKTLLKRDTDLDTHIDYVVEELNDEADGKFCYLGVEKRLDQYYKAIVKKDKPTVGPDDLVPHFQILVNIDGLNLAEKGVLTSFWPIMIRVHSVAEKGFGTPEKFIEGINPPLFVAMHHGSKKPSCFCQFMDKFCAEMIRLHPGTDDYDWDGIRRKFSCEIFAMICDAKARMDVKQIIGLTSNYPCEKCMLRAFSIGTNFSSIWDFRKMVLREDHLFSTYTEHVRDVDKLSPLVTIPGFKMITQFPQDSMHSVYHGAAKAILKQLFQGSVRKENAFHLSTIMEMTKQVEVFKNFAPAEFRSTRILPLQFLKDYKGAAVRHFILYIVLPLFKTCAPVEVYEMMTAFVVALYLIGGASPLPVKEADLSLAQSLMEFFVKTALLNHFSKCAKPVMHMMLHIVNDCRQLQCHLDYIGAWFFENAMKIILKSKRSNFRVIQQVLRRENERLDYLLPTDDDGRIVSRVPISRMQMQQEGRSETDTHRPILESTRSGKQKLIFPKAVGDFCLKANVRDAFCVISSGVRTQDVLIVQCSGFKCRKVDGVVEDIVITGHSYRCWADIFDKPRPSHKYHVYRFKQKSDEPISFSVDKVITKLYVLPDLEFLKNNPDLESTYPYRQTTKPSSKHWLPKHLAHYPAWFGTGIRHVTEKGASLY